MLGWGVGGGRGTPPRFLEGRWHRESFSRNPVVVRAGEMPKGLLDLPRVRDTSPSMPFPGHKAGAERFGVHSGRRAARRYGTHRRGAQVRSSGQPRRSQEGQNCHGTAEALKGHFTSRAPTSTRWGGGGRTTQGSGRAAGNHRSSTNPLPPGEGRKTRAPEVSDRPLGLLCPHKCSLSVHRFL